MFTSKNETVIELWRYMFFSSDQVGCGPKSIALCSDPECSSNDTKGVSLESNPTVETRNGRLKVELRVDRSSAFNKTIYLRAERNGVLKVTELRVQAY